MRYATRESTERRGSDLSSSWPPSRASASGSPSPSTETQPTRSFSRFFSLKTWIHLLPPQVLVSSLRWWTPYSATGRPGRSSSLLTKTRQGKFLHFGFSQIVFSGITFCNFAFSHIAFLLVAFSHVGGYPDIIHGIFTSQEAPGCDNTEGCCGPFLLDWVRLLGG